MLLSSTLEHPPQIKLDLSGVRKVSHSTKSSLGERDTKILSSFEELPWGFNAAVNLPMFLTPR